MSLPRQVIKGRTYMITRRCFQRQFLLRPDEPIIQSFMYCLALAAQRTGVELLFSIACSNHHHTGIRDVHGNFPVFLELFHKLFAKCVNTYRRRFENMWSAEHASVVLLAEPGDCLEKMIYALTNPVKDYLLPEAATWPGFTSLPFHLGEPKRAVKRPPFFFRHEKDKGEMPASIDLEFKPLPGFEHLSSEEFADLLSSRIAEVEKTVAENRRQNGRAYLGLSRILNQRWSDSPRTLVERFKLKPRIAAKNKWARIETLRRDRAFLEQYGIARRMYLRGDDALFPLGTYWLAKFAKVTCETSN